MKKAHYILIICVCIIAILSGLAFAGVFSPGSDADIKENTDENKTLVSVNGTPISEKEFEEYKATANFEKEEYSDDELLQRLIEQQLLFGEAKSRGLSVSDMEISEAIASVRDMLVDESNTEARSFIEAYIAEHGITEEEYWESIRPAYERSLAIAKLQNELAQEVGTVEISSEDFEAYYSDFTAELMKNAEIVYS